MWKVDPKKMCRKHLLGEHVEMHMFVGTIIKGKSISGYVKKNLVEVHNIKKRHIELSEEMVRRGFNHKSELPKFKSFRSGQVFVVKSERELKNRCKDCKF